MFFRNKKGKNLGKVFFHIIVLIFRGGVFMCKKSTFIYLTLFALVSCLILTGTAKAEAELLAQWMLDGNALDSSGNGYDGTPINVVWVDDPERGMVASFNGDDAVITTPVVMPHMTLDIDFSWTIWYYKGDSANRNDVIMGNRTGGSTEGGLNFIKFTPNQVEFYGSRNEGLDYDDYPDGEWTHGALVKQGENLTYYRNGVEELTRTVTEQPNPQIFFIGGDPDATGQEEMSSGLISDVRLYTSALTIDEIQKVMVPVGPIPDFAWYKLDGNALDSTENGNHGTEINVEWVDDAERGPVASFNGDDAVITTPLAMPHMTLDVNFTWALWYYKGDSANRNDCIMGNRTGGSSEGGLNFIKFTPNQVEFYGSRNEGLDYDDYPDGEWTHGVLVKQGENLTYYRNGVEELTRTVTQQPNPQIFLIGGDPDATGQEEMASGLISDVRLYTRDLSADEVLELTTASKPQTSPLATAPIPADLATDVPVITNLSWTPGDGATKRDVYLGTDQDAVRFASPTDDPDGVYLGQIGDPNEPPFVFPESGMLELEHDTTYYWRIDSITDADPDNPTKGKVWRFSTELYGAVMPAGSITATASSSSPGQGPGNTIDGSGLTNGNHSDDARDMWLSRANSLSASEWIQYEFDQAYNISGMYIWNYNEAHFGHLSFYSLHGIKDVAIEHSVDGENWEALGVTMLEAAPGTNACTAIRIPLTEAPVNAMYIRIKAKSNHGGGGFFNKYGLSEVIFFTK
ncbi:LamG-like jellyroll fold domain-containing protein [Planctomycetota bacterium]